MRGHIMRCHLPLLIHQIKDYYPLANSEEEDDSKTTQDDIQSHFSLANTEK